MKKSKNKMVVGANVLYCGHAGYFIADLFFIGDVVAARASGPVTPGNIYRLNEFGPATHLLVDFPNPGLWSPERGIFVVPSSQLTEKPLSKVEARIEALNALFRRHQI
jgi:hypothetical protein